MMRAQRGNRVSNVFDLSKHMNHSLIAVIGMRFSGRQGNVMCFALL